MSAPAAAAAAPDPAEAAAPALAAPTAAANKQPATKRKRDPGGSYSWPEWAIALLILWLAGGPAPEQDPSIGTRGSTIKGWQKDKWCTLADPDGKMRDYGKKRERNFGHMVERARERSDDRAAPGATPRRVVKAKRSAKAKASAAAAPAPAPAPLAPQSPPNFRVDLAHRNFDFGARGGTGGRVRLDGGPQ